MPTADEIRTYAEEFAATITNQTGEQLDFSAESLATLDTLLAQWIDFAEVYGEPRAGAFDALALPAAAYIGEVLLRTLGGHWIIRDETDQDGLPPLFLQPRFRVDLLATTRAVLHGETNPAFATYYQMLAETVRNAGERTNEHS